MTNSSRVVRQTQCPKCAAEGNDTAGDNLAVYEDGHMHCFACGYHVHANQEEEHLMTGTQQFVPWRDISAETMAFYKVFTEVSPDGVPQQIIFPYPKGQKFRNLAETKEERKFSTRGDMSSGQLFGQDYFPAGSARAITITEGELDTLSAFQMLGSKYPVVSIRSSVFAKRDCADQFDYLNSFEKIYLCFDNDEQGKAATQAVAGLFDFNKVFHVKLDVYKDANEFLQNGHEEAFRKIWWNAKRFLPDDIISSYTDIDDIIDNDKVEIGVSYPWPRLQEMTYGMRPGEFVLLAAQEGVGKTEFMRAIEYHVLKTTAPDTKIGIIHLEETKGRAIKGLVGYELKTPVHLPDSMVDKDKIKAAYRALTKEDNRVHYYSHFGSDDPAVILGMVQFLAGPCECKFIFLDHISMVVSGIDTDDERKSLDFISTRLKMLAESHGVTVVCVSHVNDEGKTRGSRNISKVADLHIFLSRDLENPDEAARNKTTVTVRKNRFGAKTGPAGQVVFDISTFMLTPEEDNFGAPPA